MGVVVRTKALKPSLATRSFLNPLFDLWIQTPAQRTSYRRWSSKLVSGVPIIMPLPSRDMAWSSRHSSLFLPPSLRSFYLWLIVVSSFKGNHKDSESNKVSRNDASENTSPTLCFVEKLFNFWSISRRWRFAWQIVWCEGWRGQTCMWSILLVMPALLVASWNRSKSLDKALHPCRSFGEECQQEVCRFDSISRT